MIKAKSAPARSDDAVQPLADKAQAAAPQADSDSHGCGRPSSDELCRGIVELSRELILVHSAGRIEFANDTAASLLGFSSADELLGLDIRTFLHPDDRQLSSQRIGEMLRTGARASLIDLRLVSRAGREVVVEVHSVPFRYRGAPSILTMARDVTERRRAEDALRESERRFRDFAWAASDWLWELGPDLRFTFISERVGEIGVTPAFYVGRGVDDVLGEDDPAGVAAVMAEFRAHRAFRGRRVGVVRAGSRRHVELSGVPVLAADGAFLGYRGATTNVTATVAAEETLRGSETRYRDFARIASDWTWELGPDLRFIFMSPRVEDIGGAPVAFFLGKTPAELNAGHADHPAVRAYLDLLASHQPIRNLRFPAARPGGARLHLKLSAKPIFAEDGAFLGYRGCSTDDSAEVEAHERMARATTAAQAASRAKSAFISNMSHELRTPLNAIIGFSELMLGGAFGPLESPRYTDYVQDIRTSGLHLLQIINEILDFSKIEAQKAELREELVDLGFIVRQSLGLIREQPVADRLRIEFRPGTDAPLFADPVKVRQMLLNLLSNAVKFTPEGGQVSIETRLDDARCYEIRVSDTGIGIPPADLKRVLEPFTQVETSYSRVHQGTGLGLPLVKAMAELHGGCFTLESEEGAGTAATIRFPAQRVR